MILTWLSDIRYISRSYNSGWYDSELFISSSLHSQFPHKFLYDNCFLSILNSSDLRPPHRRTTQPAATEPNASDLCPEVIRIAQWKPIWAHNMEQIHHRLPQQIPYLLIHRVSWLTHDIPSTYESILYIYRNGMGQIALFSFIAKMYIAYISI